MEDGNLYLRLWKNVAHNLCNLNNTAPSIGIIRVTIYAANGKVSHIHRRMCYRERKGSVLGFKIKLIVGAISFLIVKQMKYNAPEKICS